MVSGTGLIETLETLTSDGARIEIWNHPSGWTVRLGKGYERVRRSIKPSLLDALQVFTPVTQDDLLSELENISGQVRIFNHPWGDWEIDVKHGASEVCGVGHELSGAMGMALVALRR